MNENVDSCASPLHTRYASQAMLKLFSERRKRELWRSLWVSLAKGQKALGLPIPEDALQELAQNVRKINLKRSAELEKKTRHDVMAEILSFAEECPKARGLIHLGETSSFVTDNADLITLRDALKLLQKKLSVILQLFNDWIETTKGMPCLGMTHLQPAQATTVGKRFSLWAQDFLFDLQELTLREESLRFKGARGATGSETTHMALFEGDPLKSRKLSSLVASDFGFEDCYAITSQTYPRKVDVQIISSLAGFAASCSKFAGDIRLLAAFGEVKEPFSDDQVGSSAMPHKQNPILGERIASLSRYLISLSSSPLNTHAAQWLERSLDDSANRRLVIPEAFLLADALLNLLRRILSGLSLDEEVIKNRLIEHQEELFLEIILMEGVLGGGDRQRLHERLRRLRKEARERVKDSTFINTVILDEEIAPFIQKLPRSISLKTLSGSAEEQAEEFRQELSKELGARAWADDQSLFTHPDV